MNGCPFSESSIPLLSRCSLPWTLYFTGAGAFGCSSAVSRHPWVRKLIRLPHCNCCAKAAAAAFCPLLARFVTLPHWIEPLKNGLMDALSDRPLC